MAVHVTAKRARGKSTVESRFWSKVKKTPSCWLWTGTHTKGGYGLLRVDDAHRCAHRVSWQIHFGPIPDGLCVLHSCDIRGCVKPTHLFLGTYQENTDDMIAKGRQVQGKRYKGQQHGMSKLTETEVLHIRALHATGQFYQRELAKQFGVSKDQIKNIVLRKQWRHI